VVPGVIVPDVPIENAGAGTSRLRQIARDGFLVLTSDDVDTDAVSEALGKAASAPTRVLVLGEVDVTGALREALQPQPGEAWVVRPDAHLAAVVQAADTARLAEAVQRAAGSPVPTPAA
jgi:pentachlorophenol monooxygenase/3-(3-hydroxy-phenyl)propionate hydroxylase